MKKTIKRSHRALARAAIKMRSLLAGSIVTLIFLFSVNRYIYHLHLTVSTADTILCFLAIITMIWPITLLAMKIALKNDFHVKLAIAMTQRDRKTWALMLRKEEEKEQARIQYQKQHYAIAAIDPTSEPFVFSITLSAVIDKKLPPPFTVNGAPVQLWINKQQGVCHLGKVLFLGDSENLVFATGVNEYVVKNPYVIAGIGNPAVIWQCKGHIDERRIRISSSYLKNPTEGVVYPFSLLINSRLVGEFSGTVAKGSIIIPLGREVSEIDCVGRTCILRYTIGRSVHKITLPPPGVFVANGVPV